MVPLLFHELTADSTIGVLIIMTEKTMATIKQINRE